jgi:hypothetical protein
MRIRKVGRMPKGEAPHNASRRIQSTMPYASHRHEHLGEDLIPHGEAPHNRARRLQHTAVSGTGQSISRVVGAQRQKRLDRGVGKII